MSYKPEEKDWMAYLYGELEEADKRKFDQYLLENPNARMEFEKLKNLRGLLSGLDDKEVIAPPIVIGENEPEASRGGRRFLWNTPYLRLVASIAASVILIILVGKLTGTRIAASGNELRLTFGGSFEQPGSKPMQSTLTEQQVQQMIQTSLAANNDQVQATLEENRRKLENSIRSNLARNSGRIDHLVREASSASQEQIRQFADGIRSENMQQVKDYFQLTSTEQKNYIENLLIDFAKYLQQQRNDDLQLVQTRMNSLEQNTDIFKQETEQILSSIITTVGTPVSGERKN